MLFDRATKLLFTSWICVALLFDAWLIPGGRADEWTVLAVLTGAALASAFDRRAVVIVLALAYIHPVLLARAYGRYHVSYDVLWLAALVGVTLPTAWKPWQFPARWKAPLIAWGVIVAVGAMLIVAREVDFNPNLLRQGRAPWEDFAGIVPRFNANWVLHVALTLVVGLLWFDWLLGTTALDVERLVVPSLAVSAIALLAVAAYQMFVDIHFLNTTVYAYLDRATGTVYDANGMGALAALWIGGLTAYARRFSRWALPLQALALMAGWVAVWASGSRTGFAAAIIVTLALLVDMARRTPGRTARRYRLPILAAVLTAAIGLALLGQAAGPVARIARLVNEQSPGAVVGELLWVRNGYGTHAVSMIRDHPWVGVGIGGYHLLVSGYASLSGNGAKADNAQSWYRHELAELGVLGSLPWIIWVILFASFMLHRRSQLGSEARILRAALVAFALVSLLGVPAQLTMVAVTFWTFAAWFVKLAPDAPPPAPVAARAWVAVALLCGVHAAGTAATSAHDLRPPLRAARLNRPFTYGFYPPEPDGLGGEQRWARRRAAVLLDRAGGWLELRVSVNHFDLDSHPVKARAWLDGALILDTELRSPAPAVIRVPLEAAGGKALLETWTNRTVWPPDIGVEDERELGLLVSWKVAADAGAPTALLDDGDREGGIPGGHGMRVVHEHVVALVPAQHAP